MSTLAPIRALFVLYPNALASSITLPMEILQAAGQMDSAATRRASRVELQLTALSPEPIATASGLTLKPDCTVDSAPAPDLVLLPGIWRNPLPTLRACRDLLPYLRNWQNHGARICSVGTASCLLAEAGLLDGKPATTHWNYFKPFAKRYPQVQLKTRHLITQAESLYCVGSVNSIADLMVHLVEDWFGTRIARALENQFSPEIRRPFAAAAYQDEPDSLHHDELVIEAQQWLRDNLSAGADMAILATRLGLSERSLSRRFRQATGYSPQAYLQNQRVHTAKDLLRSSNLSVSEICWQVGLRDASYFSQLFRRHAGVSPGQYRKAVRGKLFDGHSGG